MMQHTVKSEADVGACPDCTVEVGTVFDGSDRVIDIEQVYVSRAAAEAALAHYTAAARSAESEPCHIVADLCETDGGCVLKARFEFSCQAEKVIFQLANR